MSESERPTTSLLDRAGVVGRQVVAVFVPALLVPLLTLSPGVRPAFWRIPPEDVWRLGEAAAPAENAQIPVVYAVVAWSAAAAGTRVASPAWALAIALLVYHCVGFSPQLGILATVAWSGTLVCLSPWREPRLAVPVVVALTWALTAAVRASPLYWPVWKPTLGLDG